MGEKYGGIYRGDKYSKERDEIIAEAQNARKNIQPSISLMEFYVARKKNLTCYAFISKELEKRVYNKQDTSLDENIRNEVQFINHMRKGSSVRGNWISAYIDNNELATRVDSLRFFTRR